MASSTTPHCSITTATKPYKTHHQPPQHNLPNHSHPRRHGPHRWSTPISLTNSSPSAVAAKPRATAASAAANPIPRNPNFPSLSSLPPSKSELSVDFSGRRSTRFVSKMHVGRPKSAVGSRHSSAAEEALHQLRHLSSSDDWGLDNVLLGFEYQLSGSEDFTFLIRELGNSGECSKAIRCFEFALQRERRRNEQGKLASSMISALGRMGKVDLAKGVFETATKRGYGNTVYAYSALISAYGRNGYCEEAIRVFEAMKSNGMRPNLITYNAVIDACAKGGVEFKHAVAILDEMLRIGVPPDRITYNSLLAVCSRAGLWEQARILFSEMACRGIEQDMFTYNTLLDALCKGRQMDLARELLLEMSSKGLAPNTVTYSTMVDGYAKAGRLDEALNLFSQMKLAGIGLDRVCYNTLVSVYAKLGRFEDAFSVCKEMESSGIEKDSVTYNTLIGGYGKQGRYKEVERVFAQMKSRRIVPNLLTYSTLIDVYCKGGLYREAMEICGDFKQTGLKADVVLYSALIDALCKTGQVKSALSLLHQMTEEGIRPNVVTYNSIIDAFGKSIGEEATDKAPDVATNSQNKSFIRTAAEIVLRDREYNKILTMFGKLADEKAGQAKKVDRGSHEILCILDVFQKMHALEIKPNVVTFSAILNACSRCKSFEDASMLLDELRLFDDQVYGVAQGLLMGKKEAMWIQAQSLFDEVKQMDNATASAFYNALTDMLWHFGQKRGAQLVVLEGKRRQVWENMWTDSCLDLHLMSSGAARAMVHAWLLNIRSIVFGGRELPKLLSILTGWGKHSKVVGDGALRPAVENLLNGMGAPFQLAKCNLGRFISTGTVLAAWLKETGTLGVLVLSDDRTHSTSENSDQNPCFQALPV